MGQEKDLWGNDNMPSIDPRMLAAMYDQSHEDGIDLLEYWKIIWQRRWVILAAVILAGAAAAIYAKNLPNIYRADVTLTTVGEKGSRNVSLGGFGGLAKMAGLSLGGGGSVDVHLAVLKSRQFLLGFVKEQQLKPLLFKSEWDEGNDVWLHEEPSQWQAFAVMSNMLSVSTARKSDLVTVSVAWTDAHLAAVWANALVARLNAHLRQETLDQSKRTLGYLNRELAKIRVAENRQALFELIAQEQKKAMLASTQKEFAFRVLDAAVAPDLKFGPKRAQIVIISMAVSCFFAMLAVFLWQGLRDQKKVN